ncbi:hypothetical protein GGTG_02687 [Gaeumannomyces tritici R3-111a-1]|uniref:Nephrocystin 3-like N-terminal domain-containing protein n=1 Tax=Gaeumannomyces tritici (strain R3-111a-1) TaxID=644352 RepID=J3NN29_GAET3|nr:hypothetical protein GGTG_02687 [Gaeumannomyces tritici R3-111a-1]EJT77581.1 hypothetical protein GGTG_02687 [Gaeumannomyces tritici R3-111a-1]
MGHEIRVHVQEKQKEVLGSADPYSWVFGSDKFGAWHEGVTRTLWCRGAPGAEKPVLAASAYAHMAERHKGQNAAATIAFCSFDSAESQTPLNIMGCFLRQALQARGVGLLSECLTLGELKKTRDGLSGSLDKTYEEALHRLQQSLGEKRWKAVRRLLHWVAWAARPLAWWLLFVDDENLVRVIHPTTDGFLSQRRHVLFPDGDTMIAHACLHYLQMSCIQGRGRRLLGAPWSEGSLRYRELCLEYPFLKYATAFMAVHVQRSPHGDADMRAAAFLLSDARRLLSQGLLYLNQTWELQDDGTASHVTAHLSFTEVISQLLAKGEPMDSQDRLGRTPLMCALDSPPEFRANSAATAEYLLSAGADASAVCKRGWTALARALKWQQGEIVERLLQLPGVGINATPCGTIPALSFAVRGSNKSVVQKMLARPDIDVNLVDPYDGFTALRHAILEKDVETFDSLVSREDIALGTIDLFRARTPLILAADAGFVEGVGRLIDKGADIYHLGYQQGKALMCAASRDYAGVVCLLISRGAGIHRRDCLGRTVLHSASANNAWAALEVLLSSRDIDIDCQGEHGETALHDACKSSDATGARILIAAGARCDIRDSQGLTPLDIAASNGGGETAESLKASSIYKNTVRDGTSKSLCKAVRVDALEALCSRIAAANVDEINTADTPYSGTPLAVTCEFGRPDVATMLLDAGADPDKADATISYLKALVVHHPKAKENWSLHRGGPVPMDWADEQNPITICQSRNDDYFKTFSQHTAAIVEVKPFLRARGGAGSWIQCSHGRPCTDQVNYQVFLLLKTMVVYHFAGVL